MQLFSCLKIVIAVSCNCNKHWGLSTELECISLQTLDISYQSLADITPGGQRFEVAAVVHKLEIRNLKSLQLLLCLPVNHMEFLSTIQESYCACINPLQYRRVVLHLQKYPSRPINYIIC